MSDDRPGTSEPDTKVAEASVGEAIGALRQGRPVLVLDDEAREDEADVVLAAATASQSWVAWTVRHTSGLLCAPMPDDIADRLQLPPMVARNQDPRGTAYTVSVDARLGVGTGISAGDRARTARTLADPLAGPDDLVRPGHVFPLRARPGGVRQRAGHTEAAVDLCRLAGLSPVGLIAELVHDDGAMMRQDGAFALGAAHDLPVLRIGTLAAHLEAMDAEGSEGSEGSEDTGDAGRTAFAPTPARVARGARTVLPTRHGELVATGYRDTRTGEAHLALSRPWGGATPLVRVHSECLTGDALGSLRCDCGPQLEAALAMIGREGGVLVYLRGHEGRGIGLLAKLRAYALQDAGADTVEANLAQDLPVDAREYGAAAAILADLDVSAVRLLSNNPAKADGLRDHGVDVQQMVPLITPPGPHNERYLAVKRDRLGHRLTATSGSRR